METSFNQVFDMMGEMKREFKTDINEVKSELITIEETKPNKNGFTKVKLFKIFELT